MDLLTQFKETIDASQKVIDELIEEQRKEKEALVNKINVELETLSGDLKASKITQEEAFIRFFEMKEELAALNINHSIELEAHTKEHERAIGEIKSTLERNYSPSGEVLNRT